MSENEFNESLNNDLVALIERFEQALARGRSMPIDEDGLEDIINHYLNRGQVDKAMRAADVGVETFRFSGHFHIKKAEVLMEMVKLEEAMHWLEQAELFLPGDLDIVLNKADILLYTNRHHEALALLDDALETATDTEDIIEIRFEMADIYEDLDLYMEAIDCLEIVLTLAPRNEETLQRLWFAAELTEAFERSITIHERLLDDDPYNVQGWFNLAHAYKGLGLTEKAREMFDFALAVQDDHVASLMDCGFMLHQDGRYEAAIDYLNEVVALGEETREALLCLGHCYAEIGQPARARRQFRKVIAIDPHHAAAFYEMGRTYFMGDEHINLNKALPSLERAVRLAPEHPDYRLGLATAYRVLGRPAEALPLLVELVDDRLADERILLELGRTYLDLNDPPAAYAVLRDHLRDDSSALYVYGTTALAILAGRSGEARTLLAHAVGRYPEQAGLLFEQLPELKDDPTWTDLIARLLDE